MTLFGMFVEARKVLAGNLGAELVVNEVVWGKEVVENDVVWGAKPDEYEFVVENEVVFGWDDVDKDEAWFEEAEYEVADKGTDPPLNWALPNTDDWDWVMPIKTAANAAFLKFLYSICFY